MVATSDGLVAGVDRSFATTSIPVLGKLELKPSRFSTKGTGTTISYTDTEASTTTFEVLRGGGRHLEIVGSFTHTDKKGINKVQFTGSVGGHKLTRGKYTLQATARFQRQSGAPVKAGFRIT